MTIGFIFFKGPRALKHTSARIIFASHHTSIYMARMAGIEPALQDLESCVLTATPHARYYVYVVKHIATAYITIAAVLPTLNDLITPRCESSTTNGIEY